MLGVCFGYRTDFEPENKKERSDSLAVSLLDVAARAGRMMEAISDQECLPFMRDLCLQLLANVTRVQVRGLRLLVDVLCVLCSIG